MAVAKKQPAPVRSPYGYATSYTPTPAPKPKPVVPKSLAATSQALNQQYGLGAYAPPPQTFQPEGPNPTQFSNPGPNYGADLVGDPDFTEANANYQYNLDLATKQRQNRIRAALIRLGFQPGGADAQALAGIDPSTAELAQNNSESALAQLGLQRGKSRADLAAELASRGMLDTGALRGGENMVQSAYDQGLYGATQDYLNEQGTALTDEATAKATGQVTYTAAKAAAALAGAKNPLFRPTAGAEEQGNTLAPGQGTRPAQTPILAKAPAVARQPVETPAARALRLRSEALNKRYRL